MSQAASAVSTVYSPTFGAAPGTPTPPAGGIAGTGITGGTLVLAAVGVAALFLILKTRK